MSESMLLETTENSKRVYGLYRVSTLGQVEKDDIPMQKQCCREFCQRQAGWKIVKEFSEKGVSGFKVSAKDRDAIQEIQRDALAGKFDILLVFMFDRLGRKDDETPFVVEWFVKNGIEVWSAMEGQQRFDTHVDKLLNYIRYWQASGESIKTSIRVKTRMEQLTQEGHYTGGGVPYGYRLEQQGRINKKNRSVFDLTVDETEAEIVKLIFQKYVVEGYGAYRLCKYLVEQGVRGRKGKNIPTTSINRMIKNRIYTGVIRNGECKSEVIPDLQIIDENLFQRAQEIMEKRTTHHNDVPLQDLIQRQSAKEIELAKAKLKLVQEQLHQKQEEYETLRAETVKVLQGKSRLNVDLLNSLVDETKEAIKTLETQIQAAQEELENQVASTEIVRQEYAQLVSWADMYDKCNFEAKKMILAQFIKAVYVRRDYEIEVEFNVSFEEFQNLYLAKGVAV